MTLLFITPVEILTGVSFALLFGIVCGALVGCASFVATFVVDRTAPKSVGGVTTVVITGAMLYTAGVTDLDRGQPGFLLGLGLVFVLGLYATSWGSQLAADLPRPTAGSVERTRPLAADAIDAVDAMGQVTIRSSGGVDEFDGYPPLGPDLRTALEDGAWRLPADLPLSELETRLEDKLRMTADLEAVSVAIDGRGRATITAAPPANGVAKQVPEGWRAVSVRALLPTGLAPGDDILVATDSETVSGTVLSTTVDAVADGGHVDSDSDASTDISADGRSMGSGAALLSDDGTSGGERHVTVAVPTVDANALLEVDQSRIVAVPRGATHEFDAISVLERDGTVIRSMTVTEAVLDAVSDAETAIDVFAIRGTATSDSEPTTEHEWQFEPDRDALAVGMKAVLLGADASIVGSQSAPQAQGLPARGESLQ